MEIVSFTVHDSFAKYFSSPIGNCFGASLDDSDDVNDDDDGDDWHS